MPDTTLEEARAAKEEVGGGYLFIRTKRIRRYKNQPRTYFDPVALDRLKESIREIGLRRPVEVRLVYDDPEHDYELIDGERRWQCHLQLGLDEIKAVIGEPKDEDEQFIHSVASNFAGEDHTPLEIAGAIDQMLKGKAMKALPRTKQIEKIANIFARSTVWVYQHFNLLKLHPDVQCLMDPRRDKKKQLTFTVATFLSSLSPELQVKIAERVVEKGMGVHQARAYARRVAEEAGEQVGTGRRRKPADDYRNLERFLRRLREDADTVLSMFSASFNRMFENRISRDREAMIEQVRECIGELRQILEYLERLNSSR